MQIQTRAPTNSNSNTAPGTCGGCARWRTSTTGPTPTRGACARRARVRGPRVPMLNRGPRTKTCSTPLRRPCSLHTSSDPPPNRRPPTLRAPCQVIDEMYERIRPAAARDDGIWGRGDGSRGLTQLTQEFIPIRWAAASDTRPGRPQRAAARKLCLPRARGGPAAPAAAARLPPALPRSIPARPNAPPRPPAPARAQGQPAAAAVRPRRRAPTAAGAAGGAARRRRRRGGGRPRGRAVHPDHEQGWISTRACMHACWCRVCAHGEPRARGELRGARAPPPFSPPQAQGAAADLSGVTLARGGGDTFALPPGAVAPPRARPPLRRRGASAAALAPPLKIQCGTPPTSGPTCLPPPHTRTHRHCAARGRKRVRGALPRGLPRARVVPPRRRGAAGGRRARRLVRHRRRRAGRVGAARRGGRRHRAVIG